MLDTPPLQALWERLLRVRVFEFHAESRSGITRWDGDGQGTVEVSWEGERVLLFAERGEWKQTDGQTMRLRNAYRWTLDETAGLIQLEHLRFGPERPVYLFALKPDGSNRLVSVEPHLCQEDCYSAVLTFHADAVLLTWHIYGPHKDELIQYRYTGT